jgi:hypothetical protein
MSVAKPGRLRRRQRDPAEEFAARNEYSLENLEILFRDRCK